MSSIQSRINAFVALGNFLSQFSSKKIEKSSTVLFNELFFDGFIHQIKLAEEQNSWFTKEAILFSLDNWTSALTHENLNQWISNENVVEKSSKTVAIVMAGNIPLVGFHDFLSVLICGHSVLVKQSSNDKHLIPYLAKYLEYVEENLKGKQVYSLDMAALVAGAKYKGEFPCHFTLVYINGGAVGSPNIATHKDVGSWFLLGGMGNNCQQYINKNIVNKAPMLQEKSFFSAVCANRGSRIYTFGGYENIEKV